MEILIVGYNLTHFKNIMVLFSNNLFKTEFDIFYLLLYVISTRVIIYYLITLSLDCGDFNSLLSNYLTYNQNDFLKFSMYVFYSIVNFWVIW